MKIQPQEVWAEAKGKKKSGVTPKELDKWQKSNGVKLPQFLREALLVQNGGKIRYSDIEIHPLQKFTIPDEDFWDFAETDGFKRSEQCFEFATDTSDGRPFYVLRYKAKGEPTVHHHYNDGSVYKTAPRIEDFFKDLIVVDAKPAVDWSEIKTLDKVLFQEKTMMKLGRSKTTVECVVGRRGGKLFHYRHEISEAEEIYVKERFSEPLDADEAHIQTYPGGPVYALRLYSKKCDGNVQVQSHRMADGTWKNRDAGNASTDVQSADRERLVQLRRQLLGKKGATKAEAFDQSMGEWAALGQKVQEMPKDSRKAVGENLAGHFLGKMENLLKGEDVDFEALSQSSLDVLRNSVDQRDQGKKKKN